MQQWARLYREQGLGAFVREFWAKERILPPQGMSTPQVWGWLNRSDVAASAVLQLVPDPRFILVVFTSMARQVLRFIGGAPLQVVNASQLAVYGVDQLEWSALVARLDEERRAYLQGIVGKPAKETEWQTWGHSCAVAIVNAANLIRQCGPDELIRNELHKISNCAWESLRRKLRDVDGISHESAKHLANAILLGELRELVTTEAFQATFTWRRAS